MLSFLHMVLIENNQVDACISDFLQVSVWQELERKFFFFFFQMSWTSGTWGKNGSGNFSSEENGFDGFVAVMALPETSFLFCCSCCQRLHSPETEIGFCLSVPQLSSKMYDLWQDIAIGSWIFFFPWCSLKNWNLWQTWLFFLHISYFSSLTFIRDGLFRKLLILQELSRVWLCASWWQCRFPIC